MFVPVRQPFDLRSTLHSGQAFRWRWDGRWHSGVVFGNIVKLRQDGGALELRCTPDDEEALWPLVEDYLGIGADLELIYSSIATDDRLRAAISRYRGMRVLRQDPWECLISFICSSASNIPRIRRNVESICATFGRPVGAGEDVRSAFPTPGELAEADEEALRALGLGYRAGYIEATATAIADGDVDLMTLREEPYQHALDTLTGLDGVGDKVANCVLLFSLDKPEAFPVDVWIERALTEWYLDGRGDSVPRTKMRPWAQERFGPYAGYANHYLFHDRRLQGRG